MKSLIALKSFFQIEYSTLFFEAQRSGDLPEETMRVKWRKDSTLNDRGNNGEDLTGGYFDGNRASQPFLFHGIHQLLKATFLLLNQSLL